MKAAYRLGLLGGEARLQKTINKVKENNTKLAATNWDLAQECLRLDKVCPGRDTPSVIITLKRAKQLRKHIYVKTLKNYLTECIAEQLHTNAYLDDM